MLNYFLIDKCSNSWHCGLFFLNLSTQYFCLVWFCFSYLVFYLRTHHSLVCRHKFFNSLLIFYILDWLIAFISLNINRIINLSICSCRISVWIIWRDIFFFFDLFSIYFCFVQLKFILNLTNWYLLWSYF